MIGPLIISKTEETPNVVLDALNNKFLIAATSWPEDATKFYLPVLNWVDSYFKSPNSETVFEFKMEYFNTASAKQIAKLLSLLQRHSENNKVTIRWFYDKDDMDMSNAGNRYAKLLKMSFEIIENN